MRAGGTPPSEIASHMNCHESTIYRLLSKDEVKAIIERESQALLQIVPKARRNIEKMVEKFDSITDPSMKKLAFRATERVLESVGILNGSTSFNIQHLIMNQQNNVVDPTVLQALKMSVMGAEERDVTDECE